MSRWDIPPFAGERWRLDASLGRSQETRTVVDRFLGGDVLYVSGRFTRHARHFRCTLEQWDHWARFARKLPSRGVKDDSCP